MMSLVAVFREVIKASRKKNPFQKDIDAGQAGFRPSDIISKTHSKDGSYSTSGSGYTTIGISGLSRAPKEFDLPESEDDESEDNYEAEVPGEKNPPVAYGAPKFVGGRSAPLMKGFRRK